MEFENMAFLYYFQMELYLLKQQEENLIRIQQINIMTHGLSIIYKVAKSFKITRIYVLTMKYNI